MDRYLYGASWLSVCLLMQILFVRIILRCSFIMEQTETQEGFLSCWTNAVVVDIF